MRLIDVDTLESEVLYEEDYDYDYDENPIENYQPVEAVRLSEIKNAPTIDVEPVRHGHWIKEPYEPYKCSVCGRYEIEQELYCHCGVKMDEVSE